MTRDEAIDKVEAVFYGLREHPLGPGAQAVDVLVALGLLKLDEPKMLEGNFPEAMEWLRANGFKIVKA